MADKSEFLVVGKFRRTHGIHGDILFTVITDFPERLKPGSTLYVGNAKLPLKISRRKPHNDGIIFGFKEIPNPEAAAKYVTETIYVRTDDRPTLPEGEYYHHQIIGLMAMTVAGEEIGRIEEILVTGANDVYIAKAADGKEILIPATQQVLREVNLADGKLVVDLPEGLLD